MYAGKNRATLAKSNVNWVTESTKGKSNSSGRGMRETLLERHTGGYRHMDIKPVVIYTGNRL